MINKKIMEIFKSLNINCFYQECPESSDFYAIYSVYNETDDDVLENESQSSVYYVTINYCYSKDCKSLDKYKLIKKAMKENGFKFDGIKDIIGETHFIKNMDFIKKEWN